MRPRARVPDEDPRPTEEATVLPVLEDEGPDTVTLPALEPLLHDGGHVPGRHGPATEEPHHLGIAEHLGSSRRVVESGHPKSEPLRLKPKLVHLGRLALPPSATQGNRLFAHA